MTDGLNGRLLQEDIAEEVFQRLCPIAEREYDDNVVEDELND